MRLSNPPTWAAGGANPAIIALTPSADGLSCDLVATGTLGTAQVTVSDVTDAAGDSIQGVLDITVVAEAATQLAINAGTPTEQ